MCMRALCGKMSFVYKMDTRGVSSTPSLSLIPLYLEISIFEQELIPVACVVLFGVRVCIISCLDDYSTSFCGRCNLWCSFVCDVVTDHGHS